MVLLDAFYPAFTPNSELENVPVMSTLINAIDSLYVVRGKDEEGRKRALASIKERQELIETTDKYNQIVVFAEAGTSNGSGLIKFKKGAFYSLKPI